MNLIINKLSGVIRELVLYELAISLMPWCVPGGRKEIKSLLFHASDSDEHRIEYGNTKILKL